MQDWLVLGGGTQDILDDPELFDAWDRFLKMTLTLSVKSSSRLNVERLHSASAELRKLTSRYISGPKWTMKAGQDNNLDPTPLVVFGSSPPDIDDSRPENLVNNLDSIAKAVMSLVSEKDLLATADLLEVQLLDRGICPVKEHHLSGDEVEPETVYSILQRIEPSSTVSTFSNKDQLHKALPSSIRLVLRAHTAIRLWATNKVAAVGIGMRTREERLDFIIRAVEICRSCPPRSDGLNDISSTAASAPSFVETALLAALWSPESRIYSRAWANVAASRRGSADSMQALFSTPAPRNHSSERFCVDGGWVLEQLLGILTLPDTISRDDIILVNFDKRRLVVPSRLICNPSLKNIPIDISLLSLIAFPTHLRASLLTVRSKLLE